VRRRRGGFTGRVAGDGLTGGEFAELLDAVRQDGRIAIVGEEAVLDGQRRVRVARCQRDSAARDGLHRKDGGAGLEAPVGSDLGGGKCEQVPQAFRATA